MTELLKYDIVLTTYHTLSLEWPDEEEEERRAKRKRKSKKTDGFIVDDIGDEVKPKNKKRECRYPLHLEIFLPVIDV